MPTGLVQSSLWNHYYTAFRDAGYVMAGTGPNVHGCSHVDVDEGAVWTGGPFCLPGGEPRPATGAHNWLLDYAKPGFPEFAAKLARRQYDDWWTKGGAGSAPVDGFIPHDVVWYPNPGRGTYTNKPAIDNAVWEKASERIFAEHQKAFAGLGQVENLWTGLGRLVGPTGDPNDPGNRIVKGCKGVHYNFMFSAAHGLSKVVSDVKAAARAGAVCALGNEFIDASFLPMFTEDGHQDWWELLKQARLVDWELNTYVSMKSVNTGARLFWHPAFRPVI